MAKKNRMGMGLDELFSDNNSLTDDYEDDASEKNDGIAMVRLSLLEPNRDQPRDQFDPEKLDELADSIRENGVLQPILVRPIDNGGYQIVAGERRWRASRMAGLTEVPVYIKELTDQQTMQMALIENIQRQDLSPIEEAAAYQSLIDTYGMTQMQVADAVGKSRSAVANSLRLLSLGEGIKRMVNDGILSAGHAKVLAGLSEGSQIQLATTIEEEGLSVRQTEALAAEMDKPVGPYYGKEEFDQIKRNSIKKVRPFLKEFELSVNLQSNIKVKTKTESDGGVSLNLRLGKEMDIENVLGQLAEFLTKY